MVSTTEGAGVELAYRERGEGPPVLLVHGMAGTADSWSPVAEALAGEARVIAYDRRGYGGSGAPEPYERTTVNEQAEDAAALLRALDGAPAVACGADLGALVVLDLLSRHPGLLRAAVLVEPPLFALVPEATERLAEERLGLEEALRDQGPEEAVARWLRARGGEPSEEHVARARAGHRAFFADFAGLATWPVTRHQLRALPAPAVVVVGPDSPSHVRAAADAVARLLPAARLEEGGDVTAAVRELLSG